jgi:hypothetical protein
MRKTLTIGGVVAAVMMIAFGVVALAMGINGRSTVRDSLQQEFIVGSDDMTPTLIKEEAAKAGLPATLDYPTVDVAGKPIDSGARARAFASYMRIHALEASGGKTFSQLPRYATTDGVGTNVAADAIQVKGRPSDNPVRTLWVTETALSTALNTSYMAESLSLFAMVVGIGLLLSGIGFGVLTMMTLRRPTSSLHHADPDQTHAAPPVVAAS